MASLPGDKINAELNHPDNPLVSILDTRPLSSTSSADSRSEMPERAVVHKLKSLRLTNTYLGPWKPHLLALPRELRDIIYFYTLTSPTTRWTTRHAYNCKHRDRGATIEAPPYTFETCSRSNPCKRCIACRNPSMGLACPDDPWFARCTCARRHTGLSLLGVCKQVYDEAATLWYANNTMCFSDGYALRDFVEKVQPKHRQEIKKISIMGVGTNIDQSIGSSWYTASPNRSIWDAFSACRNLQKVELRPEHVTRAGRLSNVQCLRESGCKEIVIVVCVVPGRRPPTPAWVWQQPAPVPSERLKGIFIVVKQEIEKTWDSNDLFKHKVANFQSTLVPQCQEAAQKELEHIQFYKPQLFTTKLSPLNLILPAKATHTVDVLGLPSTGAVRVKMMRMEKVDAEDRRARGLPTTQEQELKILKERSVEAKRKERERTEAEERERALLQRKSKNEELEKKQISKARRNATKQKNKLNTKMERAEQERLKERKRVRGA